MVVNHEAKRRGLHYGCVPFIAFEGDEVVSCFFDSGVTNRSLSMRMLYPGRIASRF